LYSNRQSSSKFGLLRAPLRGNEPFDQCELLWYHTRMYQEQITPRFGDIDGLRHVNNTVIPGWFEQARNPIYRIFNPEFALEGWNLILARYAIDFVRPLVINSDVTVRTWVSRIGTSSFEVSQEAEQAGVLCIRGTTVLVHYDFGTGRPVPISAAIQDRLREHEARTDRGEVWNGPVAQ
jgi:acyl-CoA thioester hydrolase